MRRYIAPVIAAIAFAAYFLVHVTIYARPQASPFGQFSGHWFRHGGQLWIGPGGNGYYQVRTYVNCGNTVLTDCDRFKGNTIYPGGYGAFHLSRTSGNTAYGTITTSSTSWEINTNVAFRLTLRDVLKTTAASDLLNNGAFCGPRAPTGACGA